MRGAPQLDELAELRGETEHERLDRNLMELLGELRVVSIGVQVLFAFLLIVPFSARFDRLDGGEQYLYFGILVATAASAGLLIAPTVLHRLVFRLGDKPYLVEMANHMAIGGVAFLLVAMTGIMGLLGGVLFGWLAGAIAAVLAAAYFGGLWFVLGLRRRRELFRRLAR